MKTYVKSKWKFHENGLIFFLAALFTSPAILSGQISLESCSIPQHQTSGINFEYDSINLDDLSTATLDFSIDAVLPTGGNISIFAATCGSGCRKVASPIVAENMFYEEDVYITRFAKSNTYDDGIIKFDWLVRMEDCDGLAGKLVRSLDGDGNPTFPGTLTLSGKMIINIQFENDTSIITLKSISQPILTGTVNNWPPYNLELNMVNSPVDYFLEQDLSNPISPFLTVIENNTILGSGPSDFQSNCPQIVNAVIVNENDNTFNGGTIGGVQIFWTDVSDDSECSVDYYHIYENETPGILENWIMLASVPSSQLSYISNNYTGNVDVEYRVISATEFNFGFEYEGGFCESHLVPKIVNPIPTLSQWGLIILALLLLTLGIAAIKTEKRATELASGT